MLDSTKRESDCTFKVGFDPGMAVAGGSDGWIDESKIDERRDSGPKPLFEGRVQLERTESGAERWILLESEIATPEAEARMKTLSIVPSHLATVKATERKFERVHVQRSEIVGSHSFPTRSEFRVISHILRPLLSPPIYGAIIRGESDTNAAGQVNPGELVGSTSWLTRSRIPW